MKDYKNKPHEAQRFLMRTFQISQVQYAILNKTSHRLDAKSDSWDYTTYDDEILACRMEIYQAKVNNYISNLYIQKTLPK